MTFRHILIATDGSSLAEKAASDGVELAKQLNAEVTTVTVTEPWREPYPIAPASLGKLYEQRAGENARAILASVRGIAERKQVPCAAIHVSQSPAEGIVETAEARGCDLIVMGSHGRRGLTGLLLGSVAAEVVALSPVPVLVCR